MEREGRQIEYKVGFSNKKSIYHAVVAFSNDIGGKVVIGVEDKPLKVVGLSEDEIEYGLKELPMGVFDSISPVCMPLITTETIEGQQCLVIQVLPGQKKPYFIKGEGLPKGVYVRVGAYNMRATESLLEDMVRENQRRYWDQELTNLTVADLDQSQLQSYYGQSWSDTQLRSDGVLLNKKIDFKF